MNSCPKTLDHDPSREKPPQKLQCSGKDSTLLNEFTLRNPIKAHDFLQAVKADASIFGNRLSEKPIQENCIEKHKEKVDNKTNEKQIENSTEKSNSTEKPKTTEKPNFTEKPNSTEKPNFTKKPNSSTVIQKMRTWANIPSIVTRRMEALRNKKGTMVSFARKRKE